MVSGRNTDVTFVQGHLKRRGRRRGNPNRFTALRQVFVEVYQECGGREKLEKMLQENPRVFFELLVSLMPKLEVQEWSRTLTAKSLDLLFF